MSHLLPIYLLIYRSFRIQARPGPRLVCVWGWGLGSCLCVKSFTPRSFYLNYNPWFYLYRHLGIHPYTIKTYTKNNQITVDYTQDLGGVNWGKVTVLRVQDGEMTVKVIHKNSITAGNNIDKGPKWAEESKRLPHNSLHSFTGDEAKKKIKVDSPLSTYMMYPQLTGLFWGEYHTVTSELSKSVTHLRHLDYGCVTK